MNDCSFIIVTYNRLDLLKGCINQVLKQKYLNKIIIIDNNSDDGTQEFLLRFKSDKKFIICSLDENKGGSFGFYQGFKIASDHFGENEWIIAIDDDAYVEDNFIDKFEQSIKKSHSLAYSCKVIENGSIATNHRRKLVSRLFYKAINIKALEYKNDFMEVDLISFCGLIVNNGLIKKIGLPKKDYFIWYDDTEYSLRIKKVTPIININNLILNHKVNNTNNLETGLGWKSYYGQRNRFDMIRLHYSSFALRIEIIKNYVRIFKYILKGNSGSTQLLRDSYSDYKNGNFGKNDKYLP